MACKSVGFFGAARLQIKEYCVVETHPDNKHNDLRLEEPFEMLKQHIDVRFNPLIQEDKVLIIKSQ